MAMRVGVCRVSMIFACPSTRVISASGSVTTWIKFVTSLLTSPSGRAEGKIGGRATSPLVSRGDFDHVRTDRRQRRGIADADRFDRYDARNTVGRRRNGRRQRREIDRRAARQIGRRPRGGRLTERRESKDRGPSAGLVVAAPEGVGALAPAGPGAALGVCPLTELHVGTQTMAIASQRAAAPCEPMLDELRRTWTCLFTSPVTPI